jgi:protein phosphatase PTC7
MSEKILKNWIIQAVHQNREKGSSTVCVLYLDKINKRMFSSYMGDSCYLIARPIEVGNFELIFKSEEQSHGFNIPFQVGTEGDNPSFAITDQHIVEKNDIVIVGSDGLWDNIEVSEIIKYLNEFSTKSGSVLIDTSRFVKHLSVIAEHLSQDKNHFSPFCKKALEYNKSGKKYFGGKPDDITIIAAQVISGNQIDDDKETACSKSVDTTIDGEMEITYSSNWQF